MTETSGSVWARVRQGPIRRLDPFRVENRVYPGTPDVAFQGGWLELKWLSHWPRRGAVPKVKHFSREQRAWLKRHAARGTKTFLLLKAERDWLLFDGPTAAIHLASRERPEGANKEGLIEQALRYWPGRLNDAELYECLTS